MTAVAAPVILYYDEITLRKLLPFGRMDWLRMRRTGYVRGIVRSRGAVFIQADDVIEKFPMNARKAKQHPPRPLDVLLAEDRERRAARSRVRTRRR